MYDGLVGPKSEYMSNSSEAQVSLHPLCYWAYAANVQQLLLPMLQEPSRFSCCLCRMVTVDERLAKLDEEISAMTAKLQAARSVWEQNRDPQQDVSRGCWRGWLMASVMI